MKIRHNKVQAFICIISLAIPLLFIACRNTSAPVNDDAPPHGEATNTAPFSGKKDALRIMSYNVLRYGCGCQASNASLHGYLRTIIQYAGPDVAGLIKVDAIKKSPGDKEGDAPVGFADSIVHDALNAAFPGRYAVCSFTNKAAANNVNLLFYDQHKLGYAGMETLATDETDFNIYRLYLRASLAANSHDTTFLYFILNHTESGDKSKNRDRQMAAVMEKLHQRFTQLPNIINMGDFNLRNTAEAGYTVLTNGSDPAFRFTDPPFAIDHSVKYPADWENDPDAYRQFLTTSTRKKEDEPNDCGTGGGAKFWFDHILLSPKIATGGGALRYVPHSFKVIGNDGNRAGRSVNAGKHPNTAVPAPVADALFNLSNKYPVMLELEPVGRK